MKRVDLWVILVVCAQQIEERDAEEAQYDCSRLEGMKEPTHSQEP